MFAGQRRLIDAFTDAAMLATRQGVVLACNDQARALLHVTDTGSTTVDDVFGQGVIDLATAANGPVSCDLDGTQTALTITASPVDEILLIVATDHTRERRVEELRRDFVVNASHELKTPVTSIQTLAEALAVVIRTKPGRVPQLVGRLSAEAERLSALVTDLLDLRRLEERGTVSFEPVNVAAVVRTVVAQEVQRADARGITMTVDAPDTLVMQGIAADLDIVVKNLVVNAVKYNREGGSVNVTVTQDPHKVRITVTDTGIGIPTEDLPRIFERFYRVDTARSRETGGTGLGLSIVRHAVELHGGSVTVTSTRGKGSTFTVLLPLARDTP